MSKTDTSKKGLETLIRDKAKIMADHFLEQVIGQHKIGGQALAGRRESARSGPLVTKQREDAQLSCRD